MNSDHSDPICSPTNNLNKVSSADAMGDLHESIENPPKWLTAALSVPRDEGTVDVDACDIHYFRWGDPSKPGIIMLHGFLAHARCFAFVAPYLAADYHVVAMDMSGMGDSGWRDEYTLGQRADELVTVSESLGLFKHEHKPTIVAHSFGGKIATAAMHAHGERFSGLVICDLMIIRPSILFSNPELFKPPSKRDGSRPNKIYPDLESAKERFFLTPPQPCEEPVLVDYMGFHSLKEVDGGWQWKFDPKVFNIPKNAEESWGKIGEAVTTAPGRKAIIYGKKSLLFTEDSVAFMGELSEEFGTPAIPMIDIPNARHHLMLDQPIAFITALKSVLAVWR